MRALPLFHAIAGQPVVVLGEGAAAEAKRRLIERAGGEPVTDLARGIECGARLAFVAHDDPIQCEADAAPLRAAGLLVNVVDRPELCDFTVPSVLERDPVLIAVGTAGMSAGLAKHVRLRLERMLPADVGRLADALFAARAKLRERWPDATARRRALDQALAEGGVLDPLHEGSANRVEAWLAGSSHPATAEPIELVIASDDPDELTLRQARLLGTADAILYEPGLAPAILDRARADAMRRPLPQEAALPPGMVLILRRR